ncbi:MAG: GHKL domain-containing protein, partial [Bacillota bacterium]
DIRGIRISDLCDILGILIDNSLEAAVAVSKGYVKIAVRMIKNSLVFSIENSVKGPLELDRMFEKGWSTKGDGRGLGLWYVMNKVRSYDNVFLNTTLKENALCQELIISLKG